MQNAVVRGPCKKASPRVELSREFPATRRSLEYLPEPGKKGTHAGQPATSGSHVVPILRSLVHANMDYPLEYKFSSSSLVVRGLLFLGRRVLMKTFQSEHEVNDTQHSIAPPTAVSGSGAEALERQGTPYLGTPAPLGKRLFLLLLVHGRKTIVT